MSVVSVQNLTLSFGENTLFKGVSFGYQPEQPILKEFNLHAKAGQQIAIVSRCLKVNICLTAAAAL